MICQTRIELDITPWGDPRSRGADARPWRAHVRPVDDGGCRWGPRRTERRDPGRFSFATAELERPRAADDHRRDRPIRNRQPASGRPRPDVFPAGFAVAQRRVHAATSARVELDIQLDLAAMTDAIQVVPQTTVVDSSSAGTRHSVTITRIERMPVAVTSRGLEAVLVSFPGFAQNANGAIHPRGAHNQMTFVVDGLPISDQLTGAFANSLDVGVVQTAELVTGNIPAEFGSKVSGVAVLNSRSGLGTGRAVHRRGLTRRRRVSAPRQGSVQARRRARPRRLLRLGDDDAHRSLPRSGVARQPAQRRRFDARLRPGRRARSTTDAAPHARAWAALALRARQPPLAAGRGSGPAPGTRTTCLRGARSCARSTTRRPSKRPPATGRRPPTLLPSAGDTPVTATQDRRLSTVHRERPLHAHASAPTSFAPAPTCSASRCASSSRWPSPRRPSTRRDRRLQRGAAAVRPDPRRLAVSSSTTRAPATQASAFVQSTLHAGRLSINVGLRYDEYRFLVDGAPAAAARRPRLQAAGTGTCRPRVLQPQLPDAAEREPAAVELGGRQRARARQRARSARRRLSADPARSGRTSTKRARSPRWAGASRSTARSTASARRISRTTTTSSTPASSSRRRCSGSTCGGAEARIAHAAACAAARAR